MAISQRLRFEILKRDNHSCRYCGGRAPDVRLTVDHVTPLALGGSDLPENLVAACMQCNAGKSSIAPGSELVADVAIDAFRWVRAMEYASSQMVDALKADEEYVEAFLELWTNWAYGPQDARQTIPLADGWQASVLTFKKAGLPWWVYEFAVQKTMSRKQVSYDEKFRYMCGICWAQLKELQTQAREFLAQDEGAWA